METALNIVADTVIVLTFPIHCRYLYVMIRKGARISCMEYAFRASLTNIVVAHLLYSIIAILVTRPAAYGVFPDFYKDNALWLGRLTSMQSLPLTLVTIFFHVLIATNRQSALAFPVVHKTFWTEQRVQIILISIWAVTILECVPFIYPFQGNYHEIKSPIHGVGTAFGVDGDPNMLCQTIVIIVGAILEVVIIFTYTFVGLHMSTVKNLHQSTVTITMSAIVVSSGGFVVVAVVLPNVVSTRLFGYPLWRSETFYAVLNLCNAYKNAVAPWTMIIFYPKIRQLIFGK